MGEHYILKGSTHSGIAVRKCLDQKQLRGARGQSSLQFQVTVCQWKEAMAGTQAASHLTPASSQEQGLLLSGGASRYPAKVTEGSPL